MEKNDFNLKMRISLLEVLGRYQRR